MQLPRKALFYFAFLTFGISFANALMLTNMSSIYRLFHATGGELPYLGLAAPLSGLFIQPIVGQLSDETNSRLGKRHPYLLVWSLLGILACILFLFQTSLLGMAIIIWVLSCSINGAIESVRALTGDVVSEQQNAQAFSLQTLLSGIAAGLATLLPYGIDEILLRFHYFADDSLDALKIAFALAGIIWLIILVMLFKKTLDISNNKKNLILVTANNDHIGLWRHIYELPKNIKNNIATAPRLFKKFCLVQVFTWIGLFAFWMYFSTAIAQQFYHFPLHYLVGNHQSDVNAFGLATMRSELYVAIYQIISIVFAVVIPWLTKYFSDILLHALALMVGAVGLIGAGFADNSFVMIICMIGVGILWGSVMTLPYAIISSHIPQDKMGSYLGLFNVGITLPQIFAGIILQPLYSYVFLHHAQWVIVFSGVLVLLSGCLLFGHDRIMRLWIGQKILFSRFYTLIYLQYLKIKRKHYAQYRIQIDDHIKHRLVNYIILLMTIGQLCCTIYLPSLPQMTKIFNTNHFYIQLTLNLYLMGYGLSQLFYGPLSDIYGRRLIILFGLSIFVIACFICVFATNIKLLLFGRILQGIGIGCGDTMGRAILCDCYKDNAFVKAACRIGLAATVVPFVGPVLGGYLQHYFDWRASFIVILIYGIIAACIMLIDFPETKPKNIYVSSDIKNIVSLYWFIMSKRIFIGFLIPGLICFVCDILYNLMSPFIIQHQLHHSAIFFGWMTLFTISGLLIGSNLANYLSNKISHQNMVFIGLVILCMGGIIMLLFYLSRIENAVAIVLPMSIFMIGVAIVYPNTNMGALTPFTTAAGTAGALQGGLQMLIGGILATGVSGINGTSVLVLAMSLTILSLGALMSFYYLILKRQNIKYPLPT